MTLDDAIAKLSKARKRLEAEQGRLARKNARAAVCDALRACRVALDGEFPVERKGRKVRVKMDQESVTRRRRIKLKRDFGLISSETAALFAIHKIPVVACNPEDVKTSNGARAFKAPRWVLRAQKVADIEQIAEAVRSRKARRRIEAAVRLGGGR